MSRHHVTALDITAGPLYLDDLPFGLSEFELTAGGHTWRVDVTKREDSCRVERWNMGYHGCRSRYERAAELCSLLMGAHGAITAANLPELDRIADAQALMRRHSADCSMSVHWH